jgi:predicted anti-sigma-YlaC factor YlaD
MIDSYSKIRLLIQAQLDGELQPAEDARIVAHIEGCQECVEIHKKLMSLSRCIRQVVQSYPASDALHAVLVARMKAYEAARVS